MLPTRKHGEQPLQQSSSDSKQGPYQQPGTINNFQRQMKLLAEKGEEQTLRRTSKTHWRNTQ